MEEREIDLIDLMVEILYRWKGLLLSLIIGAVLVGGFGFYKSYKEVKAAAGDAVASEDATLEEEEETARKLLTDSSLSVVDQIINNELSVAGYVNYYNNSQLMKIDPYNVPWTTMVYAIHASEGGDAEDLSGVYVQSLRAGLPDVLAGAVENLTTSQAVELFSVSNVVYSNDNDGEDSTLIISVRHSDASVSGKMADAADAYVKTLSAVVATQAGSHTISLVSRDSYMAIDTGLFNTQKSYRDSIANLRNTIATAKDKLTEDELAYYDILLSLGKYDSASKLAAAEQINDSIEEEVASIAEKRRQERAEAAAAAKNATPVVSLKYILVGLVLGIFVYAGCVALVYILNSVIRYTDDTESLLGVFRLGGIPNEGRWNRNKYTRWLRKVRDRGVEAVPRAQAVAVAGISIATLAEKKQITNLCIVGRNTGKFNQDVQDQLVKTLPGILKVGTADNILSDPEAMKTFAGYDGVVLLEKAGETKYEELVVELRVIKEQGQTLLGAVITE